MKTTFLFFLPLLLAVAGVEAARAQSKYLTKTGRVTFFSASPIEDIEAQNQQAAAVVDVAAGQLAFSVPIKGFVFKRTLMQEHFNENYMESDKFPKATFSGKISGLSMATLPTTGQQKVQVEGDLNIHGVTHHITVPGTVELKDKQLQAFAMFAVAPADYNIEIPFLVRDHIAKVVTIKVALACDPVTAAASTTARP
jgi:polyisoprenoid-binding protein YceI